MKTIIAASIVFCGAALYCAAVGGPTPIPSQEDGEFLVRAVAVSGQQASDADATARTSGRAEIQSTARSIAVVHSRAHRELENLARLKGMNLPASSLTEPSAEDTDPDRIATLLKGHEEAVALFHQEAVRGMDPDVQNYAKNALPVLQHKLTALRSLQAVYPAPVGIRSGGS